MDEFEVAKLKLLDKLLDLYVIFVPYLNGKQMNHYFDIIESIKTCTKETYNKVSANLMRDGNILNYFNLLNQGAINLIKDIDNIDNKKVLPEEKRIIRDKGYKIIMCCDTDEGKSLYEELKDYINSLGKINLSTKEFDNKLRRSLKRVKNSEGLYKV